LENFITRLSRFFAFITVFTVAAVFYFNYKGFTVDDAGNIVLKQPVAAAAEKNGIATILPDNLAISPSMKFAEGAVGAPLTMYEYSSLGCPHCADFHLNILPKLKEEYVEKGLLRIVFVNFPLDKASMQAALIAQCLTYDNYQAFLTRLFEKQRFWYLDSGGEILHRYAAEYGLSYDEVEKCLHNNTTAQDIIADRQDGISKLKMQGSPAFLFRDGKRNEIIYGVPEYASLKAYIDTRLQKAVIE